MLEEQSRASSHLKISSERRVSGPSLAARKERSSSREGGKVELEVVASGGQLSVGRDKERETVEEVQPTPPPRKKKLEKLLRKQIEENQKMVHSVESSVYQREDEADDMTPPGVAPRKARKKSKHSK